MNAVLQRLALGFPTHWTHRRRYDLPVPGNPLDRYYVHWDARNGVFGEHWDAEPRDRAGVLCGSPGYHPIRIAQYALHEYRLWLQNGDEGSFSSFMAQAFWLRNAQRRVENVDGIYAFGFPWRKYGAPAGWRSAMAQGEAISVLLRAERFAPSLGYGDAAVCAAEPFRYSIDRGGVVYDAGDDAFFEEVASENAAHILNGCIFAFWGLWELQQVAPERWRATLLERVCRTLVRSISRYDTGWWSRYSLLRSASGRPHVATLKYHAFHIAQLRVLAEMVDEPRFADVSQRWETYVNSARSRRRLLGDAALSVCERALGFDTIGGGARPESL